MYDYLLVGAGLYNAVFANEAVKAGKKCLVIERRDHIGGNCFTEVDESIQIHRYGPHIFHTSDRDIWHYMNQFSSFNCFINAPVANYKGSIYNLPFNMNTFSKMWGIKTPEEAKLIIAEQRKEIAGDPKNLEEQAIWLVGRDIYEKLVKGYTEKQWGRPCAELPTWIIQRLPVRYTFDNNYFNDTYQGIPVEGYTTMIGKMLIGCDIRLGCDFNSDRDKYFDMAERVIYTGTIDSYFQYCYGPLEYRSLRFETETLDTDNYQGVAVMNYTDKETPFTRSIEHKHFEYGSQPKTVVTWEYPMEFHEGAVPYYPINDQKNSLLYSRYAALKSREGRIVFGGRLGSYKYYDMDAAVAAALQLAALELAKE